jgi:hypothetical protein
MSKYFSMLFIWSKGAKIRRKILNIISEAQDNNRPIFISEITKIYNSKIGSDGKKSENTAKKVTISAIRKHVKILVQYDLIRPINKGGRPEYLQLTEEGKNAVQQALAVDKANRK